MASRAKRGLPDRRHNPTKPKPKKCAQCDAPFQPNTGFQKYCSPACRLEAEKVDRICAHCGEEFRCPRSAKQRYCSMACGKKGAAAHRKGKVGKFGLGVSQAKFPRPATCRHCGSGYAQKTSTQTYCSRSCINRARHAEYREKNPPWSLKTKGEDICRNCGRPAVNLHHIVPRSKSKVASREVHLNGLPLCFDCHRGWHDRKVAIYRGCLRPDEAEYAAEIAGEWWLDKNYPKPPDVELIEYVAASGYQLQPGWQERNAERLHSAREIPY